MAVEACKSFSDGSDDGSDDDTGDSSDDDSDNDTGDSSDDDSDDGSDDGTGDSSDDDSDDGTGDSSDDDNGFKFCDKNSKKVYICHKGKTICVSVNAIWGHLQQHEEDFLGTCED
jgi:hypothetical protein